MEKRRKFVLFLFPLIFAIALATASAQAAPRLRLAAGAPLSTDAIYLPLISGGAGNIVFTTPIPPTPTLTRTPTATWTPTATRTPYPSRTPIPGQTAVTVYAVGDIAQCYGLPPDPTTGSMITGTMLQQTSGWIFTLGDNSNDNGTMDDYNLCFTPTWGSLMPRLHPAMGNHDTNYPTNDGIPYFTYFSGMTGTNGYYSLNLGSWHIIVLNSQCNYSLGCATGSPQERWLAMDLAANTQPCVLAIWHQPLFTTGNESPLPVIVSFWQDLYNAHADLILNGHNHIYERYLPQDPSGALDLTNGIREMVVGTGGANHGGMLLTPMAPNEEVRDGVTFGYLKLKLYPDSFTWEFVPQPGKDFTDAGSQTCHPK